MSTKIVAFGDQEQVTRFLTHSRGGAPAAHEEAVHVETVSVADAPYLLFAVRERGLVGEQATGTNGLVFFLGGERPLFEEKQFLNDLLTSRTQFEAVPVAVLFERGHQLTLKDVVNYMELYRLKDRASMIKEVSWSQSEWLPEVYAWARAQSESSKPRGFQAAPKVVKLKPKYRESVQEESEKKYEGLLGEKELRGLGVKQQEEVYIEREKERLKGANMQEQLANFSKNKKKMAPYDIKPSPNPKIEPNLHFFLKDPNAQPPPEASIKIQTDEFKERHPAPPYKPKKTGINTATQIEQDQLFNFDKEVKPILAILTTKALESAALEIEEEEELLKMAKYKTAYEQRVRKQKDHEQKNIDEQLRVMKEKDRLLEEQRARAQARTHIHQRTQCYQLANQFLSGIYKEATVKLVTANAYPDSLSNHLATDYLDQIISKAATHYRKIQEQQVALKGVFEQDVISGIKKAVEKPRAEREVAKKRLQARQVNKKGKQRKVHILYEHEHLQFSNFSKHMTKYFDGTLEDHVKVREEQIQELTDKVQGGEAGDDELNKMKLKDSAEFAASGHKAFLLQNKKEICFTWTANRYEPNNGNILSSAILALDKDGQMLEEPTFGNIPASQPYLRREIGLREARECVNMDEGIAIDLSKVPDTVKCMLLLLRYSEAQRFRAEVEAKKVKYSAYGVEFWQHKVGVHQKNIGEAIRWEEATKAVEGEEVPPQNLVVVAYVLRRRTIPEYWALEDVGYVSQPQKNVEEQSHFLEELTRFYVRSNQYVREEEDEERTDRPISSQQKKASNQGPRSKSKKVIQEPKKRIVLKVATRIFNEVDIDLDQPFFTAKERLSIPIDSWKQFIQICENGWELTVKGKPLTSVEQLSGYRKVGDIIVKRVPKVEEVKVEKVEEADKEQGDD